MPGRGLSQVNFITLEFGPSIKKLRVCLTLKIREGGVIKGEDLATTED